MAKTPRTKAVIDSEEPILEAIKYAEKYAGKNDADFVRALNLHFHRSTNKASVTLADEFFKQGVSDYIGAAWEIPSVPAKVFAEEFYTALLTKSKRIGAAICQARKTLYTKREFGTAWAAYQHYGDPMRSIISDLR